VKGFRVQEYGCAKTHPHKEQGFCVAACTKIFSLSLPSCVPPPWWWCITPYFHFVEVLETSPFLLLADFKTGGSPAAVLAK